MRIKLRYPASPENARDHAQIAVLLAREEYESELDFSPESLEMVDAHIDSLREEGIDGEGALSHPPPVMPEPSRASTTSKAPVGCRRRCPARGRA